MVEAKTRLVIRLWRAGRKTGRDVLDSMGAHPVKADLLEAASLMGLEVPDGATNPEIAAIIAEA